MAFRAQDLRKTVRKDREGDGALRRLYPRLLREDGIMPKIGIGIRFFETKLGLLRRELDSDALLQLFGDPKVARCLVACLARWYRYRTRTFADIVGDERAAALAARGLRTPRDLRALAYEAANRNGGFVGPAERARFLDRLVPELDLAEVEQLLWLDAPDQAVLVRVGPTPTAAEVLALFNLRTLETLLRNARVARLALRGERGVVEAVCARHGVRATVEGRTVALHGRPDGLGSWARHGARVGRAALALLAAGELGAGSADVQIGGEAFRVELDAPFLADALPPRGWSAPAATWPMVEDFVAGLVAERRAGRLAGWRLKRWPDPLATERGALWPELAIARGTIAIGLLPLTAAQVRAEADALVALAERVPFIVLVQGALREAPAGLTTLPLDGPGAAALVDYLARTFPAGAADTTPEWLVALADAARSAGSLAESDLARRLDCAEELVAARLAPLADLDADVVYIEGFGLCSDDFVGQARALLDVETGRNGGRLDLGTLGRKLRVLAGRNEGLHALIAHLSGELRLAA